MQKMKSYLTALLIAGSAQVSLAQTDPHFTQNYTYPLYINPALTGTSDGDYRVSSIYRTQWGSITNPYRTVGVSYDTRAKKNMAIGLNVLNQAAGDAGFNYLNAYASAAYSGVKLGKDQQHRIVIGVQAGVISRRVDPTKFKWGDQWNPITGYNASNATTELPITNTNATTLDIGAGVLYFNSAPDKKANVFAGASVYHINRPKDPIVATGSTALNVIPLRYVAHGGVSINLSQRTRIVPHFMYNRQGTATEKIFGTYVQLNVNEETDFMLGGYYRFKDAVAPFAGIDWKNFIVGISYDVNASKLSSLTRNVNSFELSLTYVKRTGARSIFEYIRCPRL
jgi:type IX secretion system PorP/SprF family membrane protein